MTSSGVFSNVMSRLAKHKLIINRLVGVRMRRFCLIMMMMIALPTNENRIIVSKPITWDHFSAVVGERKSPGQGLLLVLFSTVELSMVI